MAPEVAHAGPLNRHLAGVEADLALGSAPAMTAPAIAAGMANPASLLGVLFHHDSERLDPGRQTEPIKADRNGVPSFVHSPHSCRRQSGQWCDSFLHGVAFLSWNQHPEPTGSRRATPLLLFQHSPGQFLIELFDLVIDNLSPTYDIEIRTIRELCNVDTGIPRVPDKDVQNRLFRKLVSLAPSERVPRHRLISNLIDAGAYEKAETEIRIFEKDFGADGPVYRYKVQLLLARAVRVPGILAEDRLQILESAREMALVGINRFPLNKTLLTAYADVGVEYYRRTSSYVYFDEAIEMLESAEERLGDPDISRIVGRFVRRIQGQAYERSADENVD
jgi:hypothetical protein